MIRIGIFFGGQSREREISFAGGRTVYDNLDKTLFEPVPIFVDGLGNFILLDWKYIYKGSIRDFYPPAQFYPKGEDTFQLYVDNLPKDYLLKNIDKIIDEVGTRLAPEDFKKYIDFAFLALHGPYGEDGNIQGLLEWYQIPYSGCGILSSAIGINKSVQKSLLESMGFDTPRYKILKRDTWLQASDEQKMALKAEFDSFFNHQYVLKAPNQGSSLGISVVKNWSFGDFLEGVNKSFFVKEILKDEWTKLSHSQKVSSIAEWSDLRTGIGLPVVVKPIPAKVASGTEIASPSQLLEFLDEHFAHGYAKLMLEYVDGEQEIIVEQFVDGIEFSCIVIEDESGKPLALPPTQIIKENNLFDYRAKYLPGISRKITPIDLPIPFVYRIREEAERLYTSLRFNVYARIDGFFANDGKIYLNDPNTTSGMLPSSFFFHQAAEIGLNPSQFITYIIRSSLVNRIKEAKNFHHVQKLLYKLEQSLVDKRTSSAHKIKVAVIMGGYSTERHISVESGRNIYEKLASSALYEPIPIFLTLPVGVTEGDGSNFELYKLPINIMLKDNADDIKDKVQHIQDKHPIITEIQEKAKGIIQLVAHNAEFNVVKTTIKDLAKEVDFVFIALHGRPGEDGALQKLLIEHGLPFNGSGVSSSAITINKYETNEILSQKGFKVAKHILVDKNNWNESLKNKIIEEFGFPIIAKPHDDGCSSAVKKIKNAEELQAYAEMIFRDQPEFLQKPQEILKLKYHEEFPQKKYFLIEELIEKGDADHFLEVTGGMLTHYDDRGSLVYEVFEPSETLATGEVLSLEEKFLAGEGQNITPARFSSDPYRQKEISDQVRNVFLEVAKTLHIVGYCRIDAFVKIFGKRVEVYIIEINSLPGMTPATCIFHQTALNGYKPYDFIDKIIRFGIENKGKEL